MRHYILYGQRQAFLSIQKLMQEDMSGYDEKGFALVELMKTEGRAYIQRNINDITPKKKS